MTQIIAHRGASKAERENTLAAYRRAVEMGADMIEIDVRPTADGVLIIHHDPTLDDGSVIFDMNAADLPEHIPTFVEALEACEGAAINVEVKNEPDERAFDPSGEYASAVANTLIEYDRQRGLLPNHWLVSSFHFETVEHLAAAYPGVRTAYIHRNSGPTEFERCSRAGFWGINPKDRFVTSDMIRDAHRCGLSVSVWTVDDPDRIGELIGWGVDGIFTNVPDIGLRCREQRG